MNKFTVRDLGVGDFVLVAGEWREISHFGVDGSDPSIFVVDGGVIGAVDVEDVRLPSEQIY